MSRFHRVCPPGSLQHVLPRFVNREFRLLSDDTRSDYLDRMPAALRGTDWIPLSYALMRSHVHHAALAGRAPAWAWLKPLHIGVARSLNRTQGRLGPVFAERPKSVGLPAERAARLIAYLHNNPVRAGVVRDPADSTWTAHRAFVGEVRPTPWLDVERALSLCGFDASPAGRSAFHSFVCSTSAGERDGELSGDGSARARGELRKRLGAPVQITHPLPSAEAGGAPGYELLLPPYAPIGLRWPGDLRHLLGLVAAAAGESVSAIQSRQRLPRLVRARRLFAVAGLRLGRPLVELGAMVSLSGQGVTYLVRGNPQATAGLHAIAAELASSCWSSAS